MAVPETESACGAVQPPYAKPPLVSSLGPPGDCMTPSREMNSSTFTFLMTEFLCVLSDLFNLRVSPFFDQPRNAKPAVLSLPLSCLRWYDERAHFHRRPAGDHRLASPRQRFVQASDV